MQGLVRSTGRHIWYKLRLSREKARSPNVSVWP